MFSFISNSKSQKVFVYLLVFLGLLLTHNHFVLKHPWKGSCLVLSAIYDNLLQAHNVQQNTFLENNVIILGSSRAKESLRPSLLMQLNPELGVIWNFADHQGKTRHQTKEILKRWSEKKLIKSKEKKLLILTVEPIQFIQDRFDEIVSENIETNRKALSVKDLTALNQKFQNSLRNHTQQIVQTIIPAASAENRRKLDLWYFFLKDAYYNSFKFPLTPTEIFWKPYYFHVISFGRRWYTKVSHYDRGFEGHSLQLSGRIQREEAFASHHSVYQEMLPRYKKEFFDDFEGTLTQLKKRGFRLLLLRLPIYHKLYDYENESIPDFETRLQNLSKRMQIDYLNMNLKEFNALTYNPENFTDGSHWELDQTPLLNQALALYLRQHFSPEKNP